MHTPKPHFAARLLPSMTDVAFLMPLVMLFGALNGAKTMLGDGDTGWHLRAGEWMLANGRVPTTDIFSFTRPGEPWFAWEWLWDVVFGWMHLRWGMTAVVLASVLVLCLTFALLYRLALRKSGNPLLAIGVTLLAMVASSIHWLARPHLFTLLFVVIFYSLLDLVRDGRTRLLWALPLLTVLWTNLHGGFFVGVFLVAAYGGAELISALLEPEVDERWSAVRRSRPYLLTAAACAGASFLNPYFYRLHVHIWAYLRESYHREHISEFMSMSFHPPVMRFFEAFIVLGIAGSIWSLYRRRILDACLVIAWLHLALIAGRNIPIFVILAAPVVASSAAEWLAAAHRMRVASWVKRFAAGFQGTAVGLLVIDRVPRLYITSAAGFVLVSAMLASPAASSKFRSEYDPKSYPAQAIDLLRSPEFAGSIFTDDEWGDYLIYRLYPETKVFIDGRSDFYGPEFGLKVLDVLKVKHDWEVSLKRHGVDTVLLPVDAPLATTLKESRRWRVAFDDGRAIVFRSAEQHQAPAVVACGGEVRDRKITRVPHRDLRITRFNSKQEKTT